MPSDSHNKALTLEDRQIIETGIRNGSTKTAIANTIGKEKSTVGKEIKAHRELTYKCRMPLECSAYKHCKHGRECKPECIDYIPFKCSRRDRSPGACNGCETLRSCRFDKYMYKAYKAQNEYQELLVSSRTGVDITPEEAKRIGEIIKPLINKGQSPYQIVANHPELGICEKTLYNYIDSKVFDLAGIKNIDLRRKTSRKVSKKIAVNYKKREDKRYLKGRTYNDYKAYIGENPNAHVLQMDTVYNDVSNGPFIQTFKFMGLGIMIAIYQTEKTAASMVNGIELLDKALGKNLFQKMCEVVLTDRGSEFSDADGFELRKDGTRRTRVFYCDPMQSGQKGSLENNHEELRYICPKEINLYALGLTGQKALNCVISNINSAPVESLSGKTPIEYTKFMCPGLWKKLQDFGIYELDKDAVVLKPYLLKDFKKVKESAFYAHNIHT